MKTTKKVAFFGMILLLCISLGTAMTQAKKADRIVIDFIYTMDVSGDADRLWYPSGTILQARNTPHEGIVTWSDTDFYGEIYYCGNIMLNLVTLDGVGGGYFEFTGVYLEGTVAGFTGRLNFKIKGYYLTGTFNFFGTGAFEGKLLKGTCEGVVGGPYTAQLIIWN